MALCSRVSWIYVLSVVYVSIRAEFVQDPFDDPYTEGIKSISQLLEQRSGAKRTETDRNGTRGPAVGLGWNWEMWWTYDGISGPEFWGVINPAFAMCTDGRRQSPINLDPRTLLHDPNLTPIKMDDVKIRGDLINTGHSLEWRILTTTPHATAVHLSGGPLSYTYSISYLRLHFGERDLQGSEHTIANYAFPAELQIYGYNSQLYANFSQASSRVYGVVSVAILIQLGDRTSPALEVILDGLAQVRYGGLTTPSRHLKTRDLLPSSDQYLTYEGSLTEPACHETVTWIIPNRPLYVAFTQMRQLRSLRQGASQHYRNAPLGNNFRPVQSGHHRTVRTNIDFNSPGEVATKKAKNLQSAIRPVGHSSTISAPQLPS